MPVGQREHGVHVVLDQQDRVLALQLLQQRAPRLRTRPGSCRPSARRAAAASAPVASTIAISSWRRSPCASAATGTLRAVEQAHLAQRGQRRLGQRPLARRRLPEAEAVAGMRLHRQRDVLQHAEIGEHRGDLERAPEPGHARGGSGGSCVRSWPSKTMRPSSGRISPLSWLISVVLPAPLGPITACSSPRAQVQVHMVGGQQAAEALDQAA